MSDLPGLKFSKTVASKSSSLLRSTSPAHFIAVVLILLWCLPYITTGQRLEWGDFSFFAQGHEAMRISILQYGQFPWYNPWVSGGVPLYANPQFGLFSIQMALAMILGAPAALKISIIIYTLAGYFSMILLLRKYFKAPVILSSALGLIWVFGTFFVGHLPAHFTFVWYMLAPLFFYLALTMQTWKSGVLFGGAFAIMALSQIHNPFMHIALICGIIALLRIIFSDNRKNLLTTVGAAALTFLVIAGHRLFYTFQNAHQFPRESNDMAPDLLSAAIAPFLPLSQPRPLDFIDYPQHPLIPHNFNEATSFIGFGLYAAALFGIAYITYRLAAKKAQIKSNKPLLALLLVLLIAFICYTMALGDFAKLSPYNFLKHLPVFSGMRVSTRWFLWFNLALIIFVAVFAKYIRGHPFKYKLIHTLAIISVIELFVLNVGYQNVILRHEPIVSKSPITTHTFAQTAYFGEERRLVDGTTIPQDGSMPDPYREYEATSYNLGTLYANDAFVQLHLDGNYRPGHPTCPFEEGCSFVRSGNAKLVSWSPNKIILERTGTGPIYLNMNNSSYFKINNTPQLNIRVSEPLQDFVIDDTSSVITIESRPSITEYLRHELGERL